MSGTRRSGHGAAGGEPVMMIVLSPRACRVRSTTGSREEGAVRHLVTGGSGFLGRRLVQRLGREGTVVGTFHSTPLVTGASLVRLDVTQQRDVEALVGSGNFDICVHAAAVRDLEACEDDVRTAMTVNVHGTRNVAEACRRAGTRLVYISTDHVFDGLPRTSYTENDEPRPLQVYGFTKLGGELEVLKDRDALCVRAPVLHGADPSGDGTDFTYQVLRRLHDGETVEADNEAIRYPVLVDELAEAVARLCLGRATGVVHFSSAEGVTKYMWARLVADAFSFDRKRVVARPQNGRAARPHDNRLTSNRLSALGLHPPTSITDAVRALRRPTLAV
jgi:dTDP-4-dehydrorhamnose reductase